MMRERVFSRLGPGVRPGDRVTFTDDGNTHAHFVGRTGMVETAKLAEDCRDTKCVVILDPTVCPGCHAGHGCPPNVPCLIPGESP